MTETEAQSRAAERVVPLRSLRSAGRLLGYSVWLLLTVLLAALAAAGLIDASIHSTYDASENRAPAARIAIAALAVCTAVVAIAFIVRQLRGRPGLGIVAGAALTATTALLIVLFWAVELASGPT
jgi:hypothetical protein